MSGVIHRLPVLARAASGAMPSVPKRVSITCCRSRSGCRSSEPAGQRGFQPRPTVGVEAVNSMPRRVLSGHHLAHVEKVLPSFTPGRNGIAALPRSVPPVCSAAPPAPTRAPRIRQHPAPAATTHPITLKYPARASWTSPTPASPRIPNYHQARQCEQRTRSAPPPAIFRTEPGHTEQHHHCACPRP